MSAIRYALKEWAVICRALAEGRQALILRKGGVAEEGGEFRLEHTRFWLYPTFVHQQEGGIQTEARPLLEAAEANRPAAGHVRLSHFAEVDGVYHVHDIGSVLRLHTLHLWSMETAANRFAYRAPGLYVLPVRVFRAGRSHDLPETPAFAGCKSWVDLGHDLATGTAEPVLSNEDFGGLRRRLDELLEPSALA
jgi:hypothetical protein